MKRLICTLVFLSLSGCANPVLSNEEYLNELNIDEETGFIPEPGDSGVAVPVPTTVLEIDSEVDLIGLYDEEPVMTCMCEWESWRTSGGLLCVGVRCNDSCPQYIVDCQESRRVCVLER